MAREKELIVALKTYSLNSLISIYTYTKKFDLTSVKSTGSILNLRFIVFFFYFLCWCSQKCQKILLIPISRYLCIMIVLLFVLKTPSDNLGDAIQFLHEFDREAAEMCNR